MTARHEHSRGRTAGLALGIAALCLLAGATSRADDAAALRSEYERLQEWQFARTPVEISAAGLGWSLDVASWQLDSGTLSLQQPTTDGRVTGLVFEGRGRFAMSVPDPVELRQLRRFTGEPGLERLEVGFDALVLRASDGPPFDRLPAAAGPWGAHRLARDRHRHHLVVRRFDADARLIAALATPGALYVRADMRTREHGWLTFELDTFRFEELELERFHPGHAYPESWLRLDLAQDRLASGRPGPARRPAADLVHADVEVDLTEAARESPVGISRVQPVAAKLLAELRLEGRLDGARALLFQLWPRAEVTSVRDGDGRELPFLRDHIGGRDKGIDKEIYDMSLVVLLREPLAAGEPLALAVEYELELDGYAPGRFWYPGTDPRGSGLPDRHTARLVLTADERYEVRGMGQRTQQTRGDGRHTTTWEIDRPAKMVTFSLSRKAHESLHDSAGGPAVATFGTVGGFLSPERIDELGADVARCLAFFERYFDAPLGLERLQAAVIPATHGQAFDGFLHIGDFSTALDRVSSVELFRAHEVAHQWWGSRVGWLGYRDQWLSEGFAEYSAMLFVEATLDEGPRYLREMVEAFAAELTGSIGAGFSQFARPGFAMANRRGGDRIGPIGHGWRAAVGEAPAAYRSQAYLKGALVLHMLRGLALHMTGSNEAFRDLLREFIRRHDGGLATTADFEAVVADALPGDWSWFFDQWVYGAEIPTYVWSWEPATVDGGPAVVLRVEQREVAAGFRMYVPVFVEFEDGGGETLLALVDAPRVELRLPLTAPARKVVFNPDHAVLARTKKG